MSIESLIYTSKVSPSFKYEHIADIIAKAVVNNERFGLTGALYYKDDHFIQLLEGSAQAINTLYANILTDQRHIQLQIRHYGEQSQRLFSDWSMGRISSSIIDLINNDTSKTLCLNSISPSEAVSFFRKVSQYIGEA